MATAVTSLPRQIQAIGLVGSAHFCSHFYQLALPPLFPLIKADLGVSNVELGVALTVYNAATGVLQTPVGLMMHRLGARQLLIAGLALNAGAMCLAGLVSSYWALVGLMLIAGAANSVFHPVDYALLSSSVDKSRLGRAFSLHSFGGTAGFAAAPLVLFALASAWDWRVALVIVGAAGVALSIVIALCRGVLRDTTAEERAAAEAEPGTATGWRALMTRPILTFFAFFALLAAAGSGLNTFTVVALMEVYDVELASANSALTAFLVMISVGVLLGGVIADRTRRHDLVLVLTYGASAVCLVLIGWAALAFWAVVVVYMVAGMMRGIVNPSRDVMVREAAPAGAVGATFGFVTTGFTVGQGLAPVLYGWLMDIGSASMLFWVAAGFTLLAIALVTVSRDRRF